LADVERETGGGAARTGAGRRVYKAMGLNNETPSFKQFDAILRNVAKWI
jgi:hypothetical protein